jgi:hypothetical protein
LKVFDGSNAVVGRIDIPDGLSVQIDSISAYANVPAGQNPRVSISTTVRGADGTYFLPLSKQDSADRQDWLVSTQPLRLYGDYPSIFLLLTRPQATGDLTLTISVSGTITYAQ